MIDDENEMCCYTCLNGEQVCDNDTGYHILCKKDDEYKELDHVCLDFKD